MCNQSNGRARRHGRGDVATRKLKSTCGGTGVSFLSFSKRSVCVCVSVTSRLWVFFGVVCLHPSHSQEVPEVCFRGRSIPISGSSLWPCTLTPHFHEVCGCCSGSAATPHTELHRRLFDFSSIGADGGSTSRCRSRPHERFGVKIKIKTNFYLSHTQLYREYITSSEMYSLHLTHPKWTHTRSSGQPCYGARGAVGGSVPCSRTPQSWYWRRILPHQQSLPDLRFEPTTFRLQVRLAIH